MQPNNPLGYEELREDRNNRVGFGSLEPGMTKEQEQHFELTKTQEYEKAYTIKRCFSTEYGKKALTQLKEQFDDLPTWCSGMEHDKAINHGFAREGQKSVYRWIVGQIELAGQLKNQMKEAKPDGR